MSPAGRPRVGFIGVGRMGAPMAARILAGDYSVTVMDAVAERAADFAAAHGATVAAHPAELAARVDIVITMLPTSAIVEQVLVGPSGVLAGLARGGTVVDMSSSVPAHTRRLAAQVAAAGGALLDAPVSGGVARARTGELTIMVGGEAAIIDQVEPTLRTMATTIVRTGSVGTGHAMKALNNLVSAGGFLIGIEALVIGQRFGLDPGLMVDVLNASTGMNNSTQKKFRQFVLSRRFDSGFALDLMVKDLSIALGVASDTGTPAPLSALCRELWAAAAVMLGPGQDHTAAARLCEHLAGLTLAAADRKSSD